MCSVGSECNDSNALATIRVLRIRFSTKFDARRSFHRPLESLPWSCCRSWAACQRSAGVCRRERRLREMGRIVGHARRERIVSSLRRFWKPAKPLTQSLFPAFLSQRATFCRGQAAKAIDYSGNYSIDGQMRVSRSPSCEDFPRPRTSGRSDMGSSRHPGKT